MSTPPPQKKIITNKTSINVVSHAEETRVLLTRPWTSGRTLLYLFFEPEQVKMTLLSTEKYKDCVNCGIIKTRGASFHGLLKIYRFEGT